MKKMLQVKNNALADPKGGAAGAPPPLRMGSNSIIFAYVFTEKHPHRRLVPPPQRLGAPQREILDPPLQCFSLLV